MYFSSRRQRITALLAVTLASLMGCASTQPSSPRDVARHPSSAAARVLHDPKEPNAAPVKVENPVLGKTSTLQDYLAHAALNNAGLEAVFNRWRAALERVPQVEALPDPKLTYRYFIREVETRVGPQEQGVGLSQTFPWFGKLKLRGDTADLMAKAQRQHYEEVKLALFFEVKDAYYEYYYLGRAIAVVKENLDLIEYLEDVARARYRAAAASHPDVIRAQVEMGKLEDSLATLRDFRSPIVARLNAALNRVSDEMLPFPTSLANERLVPGDDAVLALMVENNPELRALDHRTEQARVEIALAQKEYFPDVTLGLEYVDVGQPGRSGAPGFGNPAALRSASKFGNGSGDLIDAYAIGRSFTRGDRPSDAGQDIWAVSLSMNLPIWRDKYAAGEREARA